MFISLTTKPSMHLHDKLKHDFTKFTNYETKNIYALLIKIRLLLKNIKIAAIIPVFRTKN